MKKPFRLGLMSKLMISYSALLLVFVALLVGMAYLYLLDVGKKNAAVHRQQLMEKTLAQIESYLSEMDNMALQTASDARIIGVMSRLKDDHDINNHFDQDIMEAIDVGSMLTSLNGPGMPIWRISVYNRYGDFISAGASVNPNSRVGENAAFNAVNPLQTQLMQSPGKMKLLPPQQDRWSGTYPSRYTSLLRPVTDYYQREVYGVVEVQQSIEKLEESLSLTVVSDIDVYLFDENGNQILPEDKLYSSVDQNSVYVTSKASAGFGWSVLLVQSSESVIAPYRSVVGYLFGGGVILVMLLILAVYLISRRISAPIVSLSKMVHSISLGSMNADIAMEESTDEVRELSYAFGSMIRRLGDSVAYEKKAYLLALQSQMNPHFLFNTLSILSSMGLEAGSIVIADTCEKIASMLSYSTSFDTRETTVGDEIGHACNYLELMRLRYEDYFSYSITRDEAICTMAFPRLVLQPIVENCFEHGFKAVLPPWHVDISTGPDESGWYLRVADNGGGISEREIEAIAQKIRQYSEDLPANYQEMKIGGLGLVNTISRLKLWMGEDVEYTIEQNVPRGTVVTIRGDTK